MFFLYLSKICLRKTDKITVKKSVKCCNEYLLKKFIDKGRQYTNKEKIKAHLFR